jgi:hypothetical protein
LIKGIKQLFCNHDYHIASTYTDDADKGVGYKAVEFCNIYCPICKKRRTVTRIEFETLKEIQKIDEEYKDRNTRNP